LEGKGFYHMKGKVVEEFDVYTIEVQWMKKIGFKSG
jgi:DNA polymerase-3 subunit alpha